MIRCFPRSRAAAALVFGASALLALLVVLRDRGRPVYIPVLACVLLLALGAVLARLLGGFAADRENMKLLSLLHVSLDPPAFLAAYESVPEKLPEGSRLRLVAEGYLTAGLEADGQFEAALALLRKPEPDGDPALRGVRAAARCGCLLSLGDAGAAREELRILEGAAAAAPREALRKNLTEEAELLRARLDVLEGRPTDREALARRLETASYRLRRLSVLETLAADAALRGDGEKAGACLRKLREEAGKTRYARL